MKIHPWAKTVMLTSSKIVKLLDGYVIGHELLSVKLLKDMSKSSKAENKGEKEKEMRKDWTANISDKDVFWVSTFTRDRRRQTDQGMGSRRFWSPVLLTPLFSWKLYTLLKCMSLFSSKCWLTQDNFATTRELKVASNLIMVLLYVSSTAFHVQYGYCWRIALHFLHTF